MDDFQKLVSGFVVNKRTLIENRAMHIKQ